MRHYKAITLLLLLQMFRLALCEETCSGDNNVGDCKKKYGDNEGYFPSRQLDAAELYEDLKLKIKSIKESCGEVCETRAEKEKVVKMQSVWSRELEKNVKCKDLFSNKNFDANSNFPIPPKKIPKFLLDDYTYQGRVQVDFGIIDEMNGGHVGRQVWSEDYIDSMVKQLSGGDYNVKMYSEEDVQNMDKHLKDDSISGGVRGKRALVIGTQVPWVESLLLLNGAKHVTTLEYTTITSEHPKITAVTPQKLSETFLEGKLEEFDLIVSFSSVEHSGLGRYGDQLNPFGDLITMARAWCLAKPNARAIIGVPVAYTDKVVYNSHRLYSKLMLSHLFANWRQVYTEMEYYKINPNCDWCYQPLFVVQKSGQ